MGFGDEDYVEAEVVGVVDDAKEWGVATLEFEIGDFGVVVAEGGGDGDLRLTRRDAGGAKVVN